MPTKTVRNTEYSVTNLHVLVFYRLNPIYDWSSHLVFIKIFLVLCESSSAIKSQSIHFFLETVLIAVICYELMCV